MPANPIIARFERLLLRGDASALTAIGLPDAAILAAGHLAPFLPAGPVHPALPSDTSSVRIAHECHRLAAADVTISSPLLSAALTDINPANPRPLLAAYVAGVALLNAFLRDNWTGPPSHAQQPTPVHPGFTALHSDAAAFFLALDGEDVARPAASLPCLRAARFILVDSVSHFIRAGARLIPWWAARTLLAHQAILSNPTPTLQYDIFSMFANFLGPAAAKTRHLFSSTTTSTSRQPAPITNGTTTGDHDDDSDDDCLLPAPTADDDNIMHDEEDSFICELNEDTEDRHLLVLALLELSLAQKMFYDADGALHSLKQACRAAAVYFRVSGEMGVRTKHQTKQTAQLIARAFSIKSPCLPELSDQHAGALQFVFPVSTPEAQKNESIPSTSSAPPIDSRALALPMPKNVQVNDTDVLGYIKLSGKSAQTEENEPTDDDDDDVDNDDDDEKDPVLNEIELGDEIEFLSPVQQALALAHASVVRARNASHLLTKEEMAPYVDIVLRNERSPLGSSSVLQIRALLHRVSFERDRGRYLERCMAQMEEMANFVNDPFHTEDLDMRALATAERNVLTLASSLPPRWELMKELAISFGKIGLVKSAMEIFEKLEFWDELVDCHRLIGNLGRAEAIVRDHLANLDEAVLDEGVEPVEDGPFDPMHPPAASKAVHLRAARRPRLLCVLGEVTRDRSHFETAWTESGGRYARAKRALARMCVESEEWEQALVHFREALAVNSLFPDAWFTYGCVALQTGNMGVAANAFTTVVQQTPDNGEAWNNLGRVLHELGKEKEALKALMEAGKLKRDSWRVWNNIVSMATTLKSGLDIVRGLERLLELKGKDGVITDALGVAVQEVIRMSSSDDPEDKVMAAPLCRRLLKVLGRSTSLVSTNAAVWAAYAKLHELVPSTDSQQKAFDCRLKQVRALLAYGDWKREVTDFRHMAIACDALVRDAVQSENRLNVRAAKLQIDSVKEQTAEDFKEDEGFARITAVEQILASRTDLTT